MFVCRDNVLAIRRDHTTLIFNLQQLVGWASRLIAELYRGIAMNRLEHLLVIFGEECNETAQETAKALRFGVDEQRDLPTSNRERISYEFSQLMAMREMLEAEGVLIPIDTKVMQEKKAKVEKYLLYSKELGTLAV